MHIEKIKLLSEKSNLIESKKLFIFDLDGTIADTEYLQWQTYNELLKEFNVRLEYDNITKYIGNNDTKIYEMIKTDFSITFNNSDFGDKRGKFYYELVDRYNMVPFEFFYEVMEYIGIEFCILSSQKIEVIEYLLKRWKVYEKFNKIISVSKGELTKEDILKDTKKYYGHNQENCVLFEDTNKNLALGKKYNIFTVGVEHRYNIDKLVDADIIIVNEGI